MSGEINRINIGCGQSPTRDWINFDNSSSVKIANHYFVYKILSVFGLFDDNQKKFIEFARAKEILWADATKIPLEDGFAEVIYSSHMIEHLDKQDFLNFLIEVRRVLKKDGILRIVAPDTKKIISTYIKDEDIDAFLTSLRLIRKQPKKIIEKLKYLIVGDRQHQWMYDEKSLKEILIQNGFNDPKVLNPGETLISNPGNLDLFERQEESLYIEAKK